ncbi:MAG: hypothetical protein Q9214_003799, partial [Letrouitia sp. 1 TL-2023]
NNARACGCGRVRRERRPPRRDDVSAARCARNSAARARSGRVRVSRRPSTAEARRAGGDPASHRFSDRHNHSAHARALLLPLPSLIPEIGDVAIGDLERMARLAAQLVADTAVPAREVRAFEHVGPAIGGVAGTGAGFGAVWGFEGWVGA